MSPSEEGSRAVLGGDKNQERFKRAN